MPRNPGAWLMAAAQAPRDRPAGAGRSCSSASTRSSATSSRPQQEMAVPDLDAALDDDVGDDLLRLVFTACHPVLSTEARVALTLRLLGGLTTDEIARAFLVSEPTIAQRIVRAKRTLAKEQVPFEVPRGAELAAAAVVGARGHLPHLQRRLHGDGRRRLDAAGALRGRAAARTHPGRARAAGARSARPGRADGDSGVAFARRASGPSGEPILLLDQNRALWDQLLIRRGLAALERAERARRRARPVRAAGRDRRLPRAGAHAGGDRLAAHRRALRGARRGRRRRRSSS